jgi:hypothetical protein
MGPMGNPPGMPPIGPMGNPPGMPPIGPGGNPPIGPGGRPPVGMPPGYEQAQEEEPTPRLVSAVLELDNLPLAELSSFKQGMPVLLRHHFGQDYLFEGLQVIKHLDKINVGAFVHVQSDPRLPGALQPLPNVAKRYEAKHREVSKGKPTLAALLELADWALRHGLVGKVPEVMAKVPPEEKGNAVVTAFNQVQDQLKKALPDVPPPWRDKALGDFKPLQADHFVLWHNLGESEVADAQERLSRLEDAYRTWYYWWALHGVVLPQPQEKLTAVLDTLADDFKKRHETFTFKRQGRDPREVGKDSPEVKKEFWHLHDAYTSGPLVSGGFFARRANASLFCIRPLDPGYEGLDKYCGNLSSEGFATAAGRRKLLRADVLTPIKIQYTLKEKGFDPFRDQGLALLLRLLEDEADRAGISHNVSRQLLFASGLLPRSVDVPEWVQFGVGSVFETPLGAPWPCPTDVSPLYFPIFKELKQRGGPEKNGLEKAPGETLRQVISDGYFRQSSQRLDKPAALKKARATAWSLMYFLFKSDRDREALLKYFKELSRMPRDRELDGDMLVAAFARAFGCWDSRKNVVDHQKLAALEARWYNFMQELVLEPADVLATLHQAEEVFEKAASGGGGGSPMGGPMGGPMGFGGPPRP